MSEMQANTGGIHPGKPIIWPTSKPTSTSESSTAKTDSTSQASSSSSASATSAATSSSQAAATSQTSSTSRTLTSGDIGAHLSTMGLANSKLNISLASLMLSMGVEVSKENIIKTLGMLEGTDKSPSALKAAIITMTKGIDSPEAVKILAAQIEQNPTLANQLSGVKSSMGQLSSSMAANPMNFSPATLASLTSMIGQFSAMMDDLPKKYQLTTNNPTLTRGGLITDAKALKALLNGIQEKVSTEKNDGAKNRADVIANLGKASEKLDDLLNNLVSQIVLSQQAKNKSLGQQDYLYYQIPNAMTNPATNVDIIIRQEEDADPKNNKAKDTKLIICLETELVGKMAITIYKLESIDGKSVKVMFVFQNKEAKNLFEEDSQEKKDFKRILHEKGYKVQDIVAIVDPAKCNINHYLIPMIGLDSFFRVNNVI